MKVSVIQNSAISFSVCVDNKFDTLQGLLGELQSKFKVTVYENVNLYTVRHATQEAITSLEQNKEVLLKQVLQDTVQLVIKE